LPRRSSRRMEERNTRRQILDSEEEEDDGDNDEGMEEEESEAENEEEETAPSQVVEMSGHVLMIYVRSEDKISNFNIVLKGQWSLEGKEPEDLIYKRIGPPKNEEAIRSLHSAERLP